MAYAARGFNPTKKILDTLPVCVTVIDLEGHIL